MTANGSTYAQVANELGVSTRTVCTYAAPAEERVAVREGPEPAVDDGLGDRLSRALMRMHYPLPDGRPRAGASA